MYISYGCKTKFPTTNERNNSNAGNPFTEVGNVDFPSWKVDFSNPGNYPPPHPHHLSRKSEMYISYGCKTWFQLWKAQLTDKGNADFPLRKINFSTLETILSYGKKRLEMRSSHVGGGNITEVGNADFQHLKIDFSTPVTILSYCKKWSEMINSHVGKITFCWC